MRTPAQRLTRRGAGVVAALAVAAAVLFNMPAEAENEACGPLQAAYIANPDARPTLLAALRTFGCSVPTGPTTTVAPTTTTAAPTTTSTSTTSTTVFNPATGCQSLIAQYLATPSNAALLLPLLQAAGCMVPTTTTLVPGSTSSSTSSTVTIPSAAVCAGLLASYNAVPASRPGLLPILQAAGCTIPSVQT